MSKKEAIIDAAIDIFIDKGTEKATISDIVRHAGIAQGTFYLYFPTKLAVMPAIAEVLVETLLNRFKNEIGNHPIDKQVEQFIHIIFTHTEKYKELTKLVYTGLTQSPYLSDWEEIYDPLYSWLENQLVRAQEQKEIPAHVNTSYAAKILIGMVESAAEQLYLFDHADQDIISIHEKELNKMVCNALSIA